MSHKGIHNPFFEIKHKNYPPFSYQLIKNMSRKLTVIQKSPKYLPLAYIVIGDTRQNLGELLTTIIGNLWGMISHLPNDICE
jgi:hypothetical protein